MRWRDLAAASSAGLVALATTSSAGVITLEDGNSLAAFDLESSDGMFDWVVDGTDHLFNQWFYYRTSDMTQEQPLNNLPLVDFAVTDTNPLEDTRDDTLTALFGGGSLSVEVNWSLRGAIAGTNRSDVAEQIVISNNSDAPVTLSFFQYNNFDLENSFGNDAGSISGGGQIATIFEAGGFAVEETVLTPQPSGWEISEFPELIDELEDDEITNLGTESGPVGPADIAYAFQWNVTIQPGGSFLISKDKSIVPTPGAFALVGVAGLAATRRRRG